MCTMAFFRAFQAFECAANKMLASLRQHLKGHTVGHPILVDELAGKVEFRLGGRWESHLDFLEPDFG